MSSGRISRRTPGASCRQSPYAAAPVLTALSWASADPAAQASSSATTASLTIGLLFAGGRSYGPPGIDQQRSSGTGPLRSLLDFGPGAAQRCGFPWGARTTG